MSEGFESVATANIPTGHFLYGKTFEVVDSLVRYDPVEGQFYRVIAGQVSSLELKPNLDRRVRLKAPMEGSMKISVTTLAVYCMTGLYVDGRKIQFKDGDRNNLRWNNLMPFQKKPRVRKRIPKPPPIGPQTFKFRGTITIDGENITLTGKKGKEIIL